VAFLTGHLCRLQKKHSPLPHGSILIRRRFRCTRFSRDCIKSRRVDCQGLYRFRGCKGLAARTAALQGQGRFSGRDGLRAVPFFSLLLGQLNLWDGTKPVPPAVSREDHWSFDQDLEGVRSLGAVLVDASFVLVATRACAQWWAFIGSAAARDRSPPRSETAIEALITNPGESGDLWGTGDDVSVQPQRRSPS